MHEIGEVGNQIYLSMAYTLGNKCAKNLCKRIVLLQLIIENVVTCFLEHSVETVSCPCNTCFWYALALAVRNTSRGTAEWRISYCQRKIPFLFLLLIHMQFLTIFYAKTMGLSFIADYDSESFCRWGVLLNSVRLHFHFEWFSVILRLNAHELLAFVYIFVECTLPWQSPIVTRVVND